MIIKKKTKTLPKPAPHACLRPTTVHLKSSHPNPFWTTSQQCVPRKYAPIPLPSTPPPTTVQFKFMKEITSSGPWRKLAHDHLHNLRQRKWPGWGSHHLGLGSDPVLTCTLHLHPPVDYQAAIDPANDPEPLSAGPWANDIHGTTVVRPSQHTRMWPIRNW